MRVVLVAVIAFVLSCCIVSGITSVLFAALTGNGVAPLPYHVLAALVVGGVVAVFPAALAAWMVSRQSSSSM